MSSKRIDFTQLPAWVLWLAQDADGSWWGYQHEPNQGDTGWYENEVGQVIKLFDDEPQPDWLASLKKIK